MTDHNYLGLRGIEFTEFAGQDSNYIANIFQAFGFSRTRKFRGKAIDYYTQHDIHFLLNREKQGFSAAFAKQHGPAICSMGWRVDNAVEARRIAISRGARGAEPAETDLPYPAIYGIGDSLIYFIDQFGDKVGAQGSIYQQDFEPHDEPLFVADLGFTRIDHLTNNVQQGTMQHWADFYKNVFGFTEVRYFDIKGQQTALLSYALRSPDGSFCIPINEGKGDERNQIDEFLREYQGPGVQHIAFLTDNILQSLDKLDRAVIDTLDIHEDYYKTVFERVPHVQEDKQRIEDHQVLVDGDDDSYLLQIFTKNLFGPIFVEIIQRVDNLGFGEGNFQALFESIERDQQKRGLL